MREEVKKMEKMKNTILKKLASASKFAAVKAAGSTSWGGCHQPKEPGSSKKASQVLIDRRKIYRQQLRECCHSIKFFDSKHKFNKCILLISYSEGGIV